MTHSKTIPMGTAEARAIIAGLGGLWGAALSCGGFAPLFGRAGWRGGFVSALGGIWVTFLGVATGVTLLLLFSPTPGFEIGGILGVTVLVMMFIATHPLLAGAWLLGAVTLHGAARWLHRRPLPA